MFSVIIPLYNKADYVSKAINSVLNQTFSEFELIIVDDGSKDNSLEIVKKIPDSRIQIVTQSNTGVSVARNKGVSLSKYNYVAFLDADDWWDIKFLEEMYSLINRYSDAVIFASNYYIVKGNSLRRAPVALVDDFNEGYINYSSVYSANFCMPLNSSCVVLYKKLFQELGGFKTQLKFGEDFDMWFRCSIAGKVAYLNKHLSYYNQNVPIYNRALGGKLWPKENHYIFNLPSIKLEAQSDKVIKRLLDGLKVRALIRYRVNNLYSDEINQLLEGVDFRQQPFYYRFIYNYPLILVKIVLELQKKASRIKQFIIR